MTKEAINEFTLRITQANKSNLYVIIYEITERYLRDAIDSFDSGDNEGYRNNMMAAQNGIIRLSDVLDMNNPVSDNLSKLYSYFQSEIAAAMILRDKDRINKTLPQLVKLKEAFIKAAEGDKSGPIMGNTQEIYAGLTYGRNQLNENLAESGNRGYTV